MIRPARQRGYALLVALALVTISGAVLASLARQSMDRAAAARLAERDVQIRWGSLSLRDAFVPTAGQRLASAAQAELDRYAILIQHKKPAVLLVPRTLRIDRTLGGIRFITLLRDENARANVNALYKQRNKQLQRTRQALGFTTLRATGDGRIRLTPHAQAADRRHDLSGSDELRMFNSFGQIFDAQPLDLVGPAVDDSGLAADVTCWGSERINVLTASPVALHAALGAYLSDADIQRVRQVWLQRPSSSLRAGLVAAARPIDRQAVEDATGERSDCYSVWITAVGPGPARHAWAVRQVDDDGPRDFEFTW